MLGLVAAPVAVAGFAVAAGNGVVDAEAEVASATGAAADDDDADWELDAAAAGLRSSSLESALS